MKSIILTSRSHERISTGLVLGALTVFVGLEVTLILLSESAEPGRWLLAAPLIVAQGIWMDRLYIIAHEGVHRKLFPGRPRLNDLMTRLLLLPIAAPLTIYRKIHYFHHGSNRKDHLTAALDCFVSTGPINAVRRIYYRAVWIFYVYLGGFFLHSLISILLFLLVPTATARRINPVFNGWKLRARLIAWIEFLAGLGFHAAAWNLLGTEAWLTALGLPLAVFAWIWSILLYIYHYDTTIGPDVRHNVRSLPHRPLLSRLFLNFNEHATHHFDPSIPWYALPEQRHALPEEYRSNEEVASIWEAIWRQRHGPRIFERNGREGAPQ